MQRNTFPAFLILFVAMCGGSSAETRVLDLTVRAGEHARVQTPAKAIIDLPAEFAHSGKVKLVDAEGREIPAQLNLRGLPYTDVSTAGSITMELHFIVPRLPVDGVWKLTASVGEESQAGDTTPFAWHDEPDDFSELRFGDRPVMRYMCAPLDESTPKRRAETYKVYHHVFSPDGTTLLTKGPGGLFPHHRGLFYGFNHISYGDLKTDTWHCTNGAHLSHVESLRQEAGPVLGRHQVVVDWYGPGPQPFAREVREMTAYSIPSGTLIEFASQLRTLGQPIKLDGDPQHAGFQFRAAQEVAESTNKQTYYLRPHGKGAPGETRNWPDAQELINLPWHAMSCVIGGERYTIAMLDHPRNPKEARFSERDYGRFGSYFEYELTPEKPLDLNYRVWVTPGERTAEEIAAMSQDFISPVTVEVKSR